MTEEEAKTIEKCGNCRFFVASESNALHHEDDWGGDCHRHAPLPFRVDVNLIPETEEIWAVLWPEVSAMNWCGEWECRP